MAKFVCTFILFFSLAPAAVQAANWDAFAGGLANGLSGQQLYTPPQSQPEFFLRVQPGPQDRYLYIGTSDGREITLDRSTGQWRDNRGGSGYIRSGQ